ncbi:hypothetical protein [Macrococcus animalis]|uniref:hypothetical protein n=1 Tax=Macrococcus animalis TaxID=3395467 RepID=UPI0039BE7759
MYDLTKHEYKTLELRFKQYHSLVAVLRDCDKYDDTFLKNVRYIVTCINKVFNESDLGTQNLIKLLWWENEPLDVIEDVLGISRQSINRHKKMVLDRLGNELGVV